MDFISHVMFAQASGPSGTPSPGGGLSGLIVQMFPIILIFGIFYFLLIRPQQKKQKEHQAMIDNLKKGDFILTTGGIYGVITNVKDKGYSVKIADNVKVDIAKGGVSALVKKREDGGEDASGTTD